LLGAMSCALVEFESGRLFALLPPGPSAIDKPKAPDTNFGHLFHKILFCKQAL